ncbi:hypothetical protein EMIHUDRAFT_240184 [Emiliania huxleyi CCMP1516]|uniref:Uncharacterized protein n=2 Tax=Emiliania huxleyi TaxID=2903 RepID=A0A0D3JGF2_EMIH1|nr:hypothetical protein EMIHUDRAFT_240184 [Emiliania huxleyi CCMP1516]EOD22587.1 hypothetical protein EMIHUDRAFT_240184 [Emiliania huxleyi CCMP1516]|eukprot:XP_005775016.1 hypothetical protein EMIHUDRAFT_240184 [Emiliania huxleyi CCMP1516]
MGGVQIKIDPDWSQTFASTTSLLPKKIEPKLEIELKEAKATGPYSVYEFATKAAYDACDLTDATNDDACRSAALPTAPLPSRRVAASRGQYRWCGGGGSLHRPAVRAAITSMRGGCRRLVWLEAYAAPPKPYCRSSAWRLGRAAVVVADGRMWP